MSVEQDLGVQLEKKIATRQARIVVIGLGYVGFPLAVELARLGYEVRGLDIDPTRVGAIAAGRSYLGDVPSETVAELVKQRALHASGDYSILRHADAIFICVPTPFNPAKAPDLSYVVAAARGIADYLQSGQLVILQSTTYPGTTEEVVLPLLQAKGMTAGRDFFLAFSPERINPGDRQHTVANTPKVVGGVTPRCAELARTLLSQLTPEVHLVSSPRAAEMTKLLENIFRSVNIAMVNELAQLCERMGIDIWEVIQAATTKPFGFMPFYPGPGVGGHCIPVDPYFLSWKAREYDFYTKFIELAADVNQSMPYHVVSRLGDLLNQRGKTLRGAKILILGVAFKPDVDDARNSPAQRIIQLLVARGAEVNYHDPYVPIFEVGPDSILPRRLEMRSLPLNSQTIRQHDCVVIVTAHRSLEYSWIAAQASLVLDTMNATQGVNEPGDRIARLGAPPPPRP